MSVNVNFSRQPRYYKDFACIGGSCPMSCCTNWGRIDWTKDEIDKLKNSGCSDRLMALVNSSFKDMGDGKYIIALDEKKRCPFLTEDSFCSIQRELGAEYLSNTCMVYPRSHRASGGFLHNSCSTSCYRVIDMLCEYSGCMKLEERKLPKGNVVNGVKSDSKEDIAAHPELTHRHEIFKFLYDYISDTSRSVETAVYFGAVAMYNIEQNIRSGGWKLPYRQCFPRF